MSTLACEAEELLIVLYNTGMKGPLLDWDRVIHASGRFVLTLLKWSLDITVAYHTQGSAFRTNFMLGLWSSREVLLLRLAERQALNQ